MSALEEVSLVVVLTATCGASCVGANWKPFWRIKQRFSWYFLALMENHNRCVVPSAFLHAIPSHLRDETVILIVF